MPEIGDQVYFLKTVEREPGGYRRFQRIPGEVVGFAARGIRVKCEDGQTRYASAWNLEARPAAGCAIAVPPPEDGGTNEADWGPKP